jgi:hypothetical protein
LFASPRNCCRAVQSRSSSEQPWRCSAHPVINSAARAVQHATFGTDRRRVRHRPFDRKCPETADLRKKLPAKKRRLTRVFCKIDKPPRHDTGGAAAGRTWFTAAVGVPPPRSPPSADSARRAASPQIIHRCPAIYAVTSPAGTTFEFAETRCFGHRRTLRPLRRVSAIEGLCARCGGFRRNSSRLP